MTAQPQPSVLEVPTSGNAFGRAVAAIAVIALGAVGGCASPAKAPPQVEYIVAARFDLGLAAQAANESPGSLISQMRGLRARGFNAVVLDYVDDASRPAALSTASECGLRAYISDRQLHDYLLTGRLRDSKSLKELMQEKFAPLSAHAGFGGLALMAGYPSERASAALSAMDETGTPCIVPGQSGYPPHRCATVSWLDAQGVINSAISPVERLLLEFHTETYSGWNDGVVVDMRVSQAAPNASPPAEVETSNDTTSSESVESLAVHGPKSLDFAVDSVIRRAQHWGAKLQGCGQVVLYAPDAPADSMRTALFYRGGRRFIFLFNQSSEPARRTIRFPAALAGRPILRAVEVPSIAERLAGEVIPTRHGELAIPVALRPGDAALHELF